MATHYFARNEKAAQYHALMAPKMHLLNGYEEGSEVGNEWVEGQDIRTDAVGICEDPLFLYEERRSTLGNMFVLHSAEQVTEEIDAAYSFVPGLMKQVYADNKKLLDELFADEIVYGTVAVWGRPLNEDYEVNLIDVIRNDFDHTMLGEAAKRPRTAEVNKLQLECALRSGKGTIEAILKAYHQVDGLRSQPEIILDPEELAIVKETYRPIHARFGDIRAYKPELLERKDECHDFVLRGKEHDYFVFSGDEGAFVVRIGQHDHTSSLVPVPPVFTDADPKKVLSRLQQTGHIVVDTSFAQLRLAQEETNAVVRFYRSKRFKKLKEENPGEAEIAARIATGEKVGMFQRLRFLQNHGTLVFGKKSNWTAWRDLVYKKGYVETLPIELQMMFMRDVGKSPLVSGVLETLHPREPAQFQLAYPRGFISYFTCQGLVQQKEIAEKLQESGVKLYPQVHKLLDGRGLLQ